MRIKIDKTLLINSIDIVSKAMDKDVPILNNILLSVDTQNQMLLMSQDTQMLIQHRETLTNMDFESGSVLLSPLAIEALKKAPKGEILLESTDNTSISIKSGKLESNILTMNPEEYKKIELETDSLTQISVSGEDLKNYVKVIYAAAVEETRPVLTGIYSVIKDNTLEVSALDGYRLGQTKINISKIVKAEALNFLLNYKKLQVLLGILANAANVMINVTKGYVYFITPQSVVAIRRMDQEFINVDGILSEPKNTSDKTTIFNRVELMEALERVLIFSINKEQNNLCTLAITSDNLSVKATSAAGRSKEVIACQSEGVEGEFIISFNAKYLLDTLKNNFTETTITMRYLGPEKPVLFLGKDEIDLGMILPIRSTT